MAYTSKSTKACLVLPTDRVCESAIKHLGNEAKLACELFGINIVMLILDTSRPENFLLNKYTVEHLNLPTKIQVLHLSKKEQREYIQTWAGAIEPSITPKVCTTVVEQLLPDGVSYGAATNRAFLFANHLNCDTVHRRDSDSNYQCVKGERVYPIIHELQYLGPNSEAINKLENSMLLGSCRDIHMVGGSYVGAWSMDVEELYQKNQQAFYHSVAQCMPEQLSEYDQHALVDELFVNRDVAAFKYDEVALGYANAAPVDMCNISFWRIAQQLPVPNALNTIGTDYFLIAVLQALQVPTVHHNRHIDNYHTTLRKTDKGFIEYQYRVVKFYLYMSYLYAICAEINECHKDYVDVKVTLTAPLLSRIIKSTLTPQKLIENQQKLQKIIAAYETVDGSYHKLAKQLTQSQEGLVEEAQNDMQLFVEWLQLWDALINASAKQQLKRLDT